MPTDVNATTLVGLADAKAWLKMASSPVLSGSTVNGATVGDATGFKPNMPLTWIDSTGVVKGTTFCATIVGGAITWVPALAQAPSVGDLITDGTRDQQLIRLLNGLSGSLERVTARIFKSRSVTEQFTGDRSSLFVADFRPIISVQSLVIDGVTYDPSQYVVDAKMGIIKLASGYAFSNVTVGNCIVTYTAGYDGSPTWPLPDDAIMVVLETMKIAYDGWQTGGVSASSVHVGNSTLTAVRDWPPQVQGMITGLVDQRRMFMSKRL